MKKFFNVLRKAAITGLIAAVLMNSTAFATTGIADSTGTIYLTETICKDSTTGKLYQYNYSDLVRSLLDGTPLFEDFKAKQFVGFKDSVAGYVDVQYLAQKYLEDKKNFNLNDAIKSAPADSIAKITGTVSTVIPDASGKPIVQDPKMVVDATIQGSTKSSDKDNSATIPTRNLNVVNVSAVNSKVLFVTLDKADTVISTSQFTVKDGAGKDVAVSSAASAAWDSSKETVILTLGADTVPGAAYTLTCGTTSVNFEGKTIDTTKPTITAVESTDYNKVWIAFSEPVKLEGLKVTLAKKYGDKAALAINSINYVSGDPAIIELTTADQLASTLYGAVIEGAADFANNTMDRDDDDTFVGTKKDDSKQVVSSAKAIGYNKLYIEFGTNVDPAQIATAVYKVEEAYGTKAAVAVTSAAAATSADATEFSLAYTSTSNPTAATAAKKGIVLYLGTALKTNILYKVTVTGLGTLYGQPMSTTDTDTYKTFTPAVMPVSAGSEQADRFYVKFSGSVSAVDYKNVVTSGNWSGHPFGIQYKGASQQYKNIKISDVYNTAQDTLMFVLNTDDFGCDTPSIAPTIGKGAGQLEVMDSSFEGTGTAGNFLKNGTSHTIVFSNNITGISLNSPDITFTLSDTVKPSISSVIATTSSAITITTSEAIAQNVIETAADDTINTHFTIDGKNVRLCSNPALITDAKIKAAKDSNEIIVTRLCVGKYCLNPQVVDLRNTIDIDIDQNFALSAGTHHIKVTDLQDYAGNTNTQELDFNVQ